MKMITTMDWIKSISVPDWWFLGLSEKDRLRIEKERGIDWNDLSNVGKEMIYREEKKKNEHIRFGKRISQGISD